MPSKTHSAIVEMFGKKRQCSVTAYGEPLDEYHHAQVLWIERAEDEYAIGFMKEPFCRLERSNWMTGTPVSH